MEHIFLTILKHYRLWATNANATVQAIRDTGATNIVLVPGI
jgi:hypothetical protein